ETEAQGYLHPYAVAKLLAAQARERGTRELKLLELGANNCAFATSLLKLLTTLTIHGEVALERIDYFAVELARRSLSTFLARDQGGGFQRVARGAAGRPLVGALTRPGVPPSKPPLLDSGGGGLRGGGAGGV